MKRFRFNKIKWDKILSAALVVVLLAGCIAGLAALFNNKTTDVSNFNFKKGALDSAGYYVESDTSIYTKDLIECQGLVIEPDFEATGSYQVYYYGTNKKFVGKTDVFDAHTDGVYNKEDTFSFAKYCRIVISPETPTDDDGYPVEDWKIRFWEVSGYADDYKISVSKNQNVTITSENMFVVSEEYRGLLADSSSFDFAEHAEYSMSAWIDTTGAKRIKVVCPVPTDSTRTSYRIYFGVDNTITMCQEIQFGDCKFNGDSYEIVLDIPDNYNSVILSYLNDYPLEVYLIG